MDTFLKYLITAVVVYFFYKLVYDGTESVKSSLDGKYYKVRFGSDKQKKANLLSLLNIKFDILINTLKNDPLFKNDTPVQRLISNYSKGVTIKETGHMENDAAYVINKQHMSFCLQDSPFFGNSKNDNIEDTNLITYVGIHELAHIMSIETGHGSEFIKNFEFLLNYSKKITYTDPFSNTIGFLYIPLNELKTTDNYCGVLLSNSIK
jgi:hypothetical protein